MKLLFISTLKQVSWGGSEELWSQCALYLLKQSHDITFVVNTSGEVNPLKVLEKNGAHKIAIKRAGFLKTVVKRKIGYSEPAQILNKVNPDFVLISLSSYFLGHEWMHACAQRGIPFSTLFQIVSDEFRLTPHQGIGELKSHLQTSVCNYFVSHQNKRQMEKHLATKLPNSQVVWNPYKGDWNQEFQYPARKSDYKLAVVASYTPSHKGQDVLFEVLADNKWKSRNLSITLCGKGLYEDYLKDLANFYALSNVTFGGQQPVDKIWEDHHALLLPSRKEGMSLALIEAMMMGRFGISTDVGGAREIIEDNVNGFIAKGPTAELLDEAMERAWARRNDWQNISEKAFHSIRQQIPINPSGYLADKIILSLKL